MALVKCKECNNQISSSAKTCPRCGKKRFATGDKVAVSIMLFLMASGFAIYVTSESGTVAPHHPALDHGKPLFVMRGSALCPTEDELAALEKSGPNSCKKALADLPAYELERKGVIAPRYRLRVTLPDGQVIEAWTPVEGLRN